jgi:hypothetical protein
VPDEANKNLIDLLKVWRPKPIFDSSFSHPPPRPTGWRDRERNTGEKLEGRERIEKITIR